MKNYLRALQEYEENNNCFELLCDFMSYNSHSELVDHYCEGKVNLPSFILLKKLKEKYASLLFIDHELNILFSNAITYSKLFYAKTVSLIKTLDLNSQTIEKIFTNKIQPIGQKLINIILQINARIKIVRLKKKKLNIVIEPTQKKLSFFNFLSIWFNIIFYKIDLFMVIHKKIAKLTYFLIFFCTLWLANPFLSEILSYSLFVFFNISYIICIIIFVSLLLPVKDFGKIDIYGKNNVAYKYRVFFNNISNKKMYYMFALRSSKKL